MIDGYHQNAQWRDWILDCPEGVWTARLDQKLWGKAANLRLYFTDVATGNKYWFSVFHTYQYHPRDGSLDFKNGAEPGETFELTTRKTRDGKPNLMSARKIAAAVVEMYRDAKALD